MATPKPTDADVGWAATGDATIGWVGTLVTEPTNKAAGFVVGDKLPGRYWNWLFRLLSYWLQFIDERFDDGADENSFTVQAPLLGAGDLDLNAGTRANDTANQPGGGVYVNGGTTTGNVGSAVYIQAATAAGSGTTTHDPEPYLTADGQANVVLLSKSLQLHDIVTSNEIGSLNHARGMLLSRLNYSRCGAWLNFRPTANWSASTLTNINSGTTPSDVTVSAIPECQSMEDGSRIRLRGYFTFANVTGSGNATVGFQLAQVTAINITFANPADGDVIFVDVTITLTEAPDAATTAQIRSFTVINATGGDQTQNSRSNTSFDFSSAPDLEVRAGADGTLEYDLTLIDEDVQIELAL